MKEKTETPILKRRFSDYPEHVVVLHQQAEVQLKRTEIDTEAQRLATLLSNHRRPIRVLSRTGKALMVKLGIAPETAAELSSEELTEMLAAARAERKACDEVLEALKLKREILETQLTREICLALGDEHKAIGKDICDSELALERANERERLFFEALAEDGVQTSGHLQPMAVPAIGRLAERESNIRRHLKEAHKYGIPGLEEFVVDLPFPRGAVVKVKLRTSMSSPEGHYPAGSVIQSDIGQFLIEKRYATLAEPTDKVTPIRRAPTDGKWGWHEAADWR